MNVVGAARTGVVASTTLTNRMLQPLRGGLGVRHALWVFVAPRALFSRVEDTGAYGLSLVTLLGLVMLVGYSQVQTALYDRMVEQRTETRLGELEEAQLHLVDRIEFKDRMESIRKAAVFETTITRLGVIVLKPLYFLASLMIIASVLYAMVALTGRKPEYHTLMSIGVYAAYIELVGCVLQLGMMLYYRTTAVDTSLRELGSPALAAVWGGIDPFRIWFWVLVAVGLTVTQQLSRRMAIVSCTMLCLMSAGMHAAMGLAQGAGA